ncbi:MAG TPA: CehA/McbA family metallohydrolase [Abditibacteriaceae bacterium]|nr:CehA/McbA family metallohydrolase [Abditibacteriaceae bacterium]
MTNSKSQAASAAGSTQAAPRRPLLMRGYRKHQSMHNEGNAARRWEYPLVMCRWIVEDTARRVADSCKEFPWKFYRGDCHSHTQHSDGIGTVADTALMSQAAGLDFQFVTDHWGVTQAPECRKHGLWVGQEPVTQLHHMGILGLDHAFTPRHDFLGDYAEAKRLGATVFVPHPTGWWPATVYSEEQKRALEELPAPFLMEICNGANNIVNAFDYTDDAAVELWDHLLLLGRVVHALGNTDAHAPHAIGMVWNGVFAPRCDQPAILRALRGGRSFVSDGPLIHISLGRAQMGTRAKAPERADALQVTAVDARGLASVRVVADGAEIACWPVPQATKLKQSLPLPASATRYVRVEVRARDGRRAFSNPIYL